MFTERLFNLTSSGWALRAHSKFSWLAAPIASGALIVVGCAILAVTFATPASAGIMINFDVDANGNAIAAPTSFSETSHLTGLYSSLGVTFSGSAANCGGVILNQYSNFGVNAHSLSNFLAFNLDARAGDSSTPTDPEIISFTFPASSVSIYASTGIGGPATFTMQGFNNGDLVATDSQVTSGGVWAPLAISSLRGINRVQLAVSGDRSFVFDDLSIQPIPEPSTFALLGVGAIGLLGYAWRRSRGRGLG